MLQGSEEEEEEDEEDDENRKAKGIEHLIEIENPNRVKQKTKKVTALDTSGAGASQQPELSRRQRYAT